MTSQNLCLKPLNILSDKKEGEIYYEEKILIILSIITLMVCAGCQTEDIGLGISIDSSSIDTANTSNSGNNTINNDLESYISDEGADDFIKIYNATDLRNIENKLDGNYRLMNDIDLSSYGNWTPLGSSSKAEFSGVLDGNGYNIRNMNIDLIGEGSYHYAGLFAGLSHAKIMNLGLVDGNVYLQASAGAMYCGSIAGVASESEIINCYNTSQVRTHVINEGEASRTCSSHVGGFVGNATGITFINCYNLGYVEAALNAYADSHVSGFAGNANAEEGVQVRIISCYNAGELRSGWHSNGRPGGIINAFIYSDSQRENYILENVYYSSQEGQLKNALQGVDDAVFTEVSLIASKEMNNPAQYPGFDFENIWAISPDKNGGYPYLRTQK